MEQEIRDEFQEPTDEELVVIPLRKTTPSVYEEFIYEQNIPIYREHGVYNIRQLPLAPWQRMGGQGTFIQLDGQAGVFGLYVVEVPAGGVLNTERHIYEEIFMVFEGRGSTEVWREGSAKKQTFEWQAGTSWAMPLNLWHRLVNATTSPALVLVGTSAPRVMELFPNRSFIFDNPFEFWDRYDESEDYFKPRAPVVTTETGFIVQRTNLIPDFFNSYLPKSNLRGPGARGLYGLRIAGAGRGGREGRMGGNTFLGGGGAGQEYPPGRYSNAHAHLAGRVFVCLKGKGYQLKWPKELGLRPWEAGKGHLVKRQDFVSGGLSSAVPGDGAWFHQHFNSGKEPLRMSVFSHWIELPRQAGDPPHYGTGRELADGGHTLPYREEDPQIRKIYQEELAKEGVEFTMPDWAYTAKARQL